MADQSQRTSTAVFCTDGAERTVLPAAVSPASDHGRPPVADTAGNDPSGTRFRVIRSSPATWILFFVGLTGLAAVAYGCAKHKLYREEYWPDGSLRQMVCITLGYCVLCAILWLRPALRGNHRWIIPLLMSVLMVGGAGLGGAAAPLVLLISSLALGDLLTRSSSRCADQHATIHVLVATVSGLCLWSLVIWALAHFRVNYPLVYAVVLGLPIFLDHKGLARFGRQLPAWAGDPRQAEVSAGSFFMACLGLGVLLIHLTVSMWPEVGADALGMHLDVAARMDWKHSFDFDIHRQVANLLPYFSNWLFAAAYLLGGESAAKLTNGLFFLLSAAGCWELVKRYCQPGWAWLAVAIYAATPLCLATSFTLFPENTMILASVVLWLAIADLDRAESLRWYCAVAVLMAFPILIKVSGLFLAVGAALPLAISVAKNRGIFGICRLAIWLAPLVFLVSFPPYLYAWCRTGNPVFPFYNGIFHSPYYPPMNFVDTRWIGHCNWAILYQMTFLSDWFGEAAPGAIGIHYLLLAPLALVAGIRIWNRTIWAGLGMLLVYAAGVLLFVQYMRYLLPIAPMVVVMGVLAIEKATLGSRIRPAVFCLLLALCGLDLLLLPTGYWALRGMRLGTAFSPRSRTDYVRRIAPTRLAVAGINATTGELSRVGFLGHWYGAGLHGEPFYGVWYNQEFCSELGQVATARDVLALIDKWQLTHCLYDPLFDHPQRSIIEQALKSVAACQQQIESVTVLTIDRVAVARQLVTHELLRDDKFLNIGSDWNLEKGRRSSATGRGVVLQPGGVLVQRIDAALGGKRYLMCVDVQGSPAGSNCIRLQVRWFLAKSGDVPVWKSMQPLPRSAHRELCDLTTAPEDAIAAEVYVVNDDGPDSICVERVSFRW